MDSKPDAKLVMRLRAATGMPVRHCVNALAKLPDGEREAFVREYEEGKPLEAYYPLRKPDIGVKD